MEFTNEELVFRIQSGDSDLLYPLWERNMPLIKKVVFKYHCQEYPPEITKSGRHEANSDLLQESYLCLIATVEDFTPDGGRTFISYYLQRLEWHFFRFIHQNKTLRLPEWLVQLHLRYRRYRDKFYLINGRYPSDSEVCESLQINDRQFKYVKGVNPTPLSLNSVVGDSDSDTQLMELLPEDDAANAINTVIDGIYNENLCGIWESIRRIVTDRELNILQLRFRSNMSISDISKCHSLSNARIQQIIENCMTKIRTNGIAMKEIESLSEGTEHGYYIGGLTRYKNNKFTSCTEKMAVHRAMMHQKPHITEDISDLEKDLISIFGQPS